MAEIVCLAEPRPRVGERVLAVFRPEDGADPMAGLRAAASRLPPASRPGRFVRRVQLPRTPAGKVARDQLADELPSRLFPLADSNASLLPGLQGEGTTVTLLLPLFDVSSRSDLRQEAA